MSGPLDFEPGEAGRRLEADDDRPPRPPRRPGPPPGASRYGWFLGVAGIVLVTLVTINTFRTEGRGATGLEVGSAMAPFAAPLALTDLEGDVNVARKANQGDAGRVPACALRGPKILNACDLWRSRPVVLAFMATRGDSCIKELDALERVRRRFPDVAFAAIAIRGNRDDLRDLIRSRGWRFPVGFDRDGALANLYGVAVCPQIVFGRRGGRVVDTTFGELSEAELMAQVRALR